MDAIPGRFNSTGLELLTAGQKVGQCSELCGTGHGFMPIVVIAKTPEDFATWAAEQVAAKKASQQPAMPAAKPITEAAPATTAPAAEPAAKAAPASTTAQPAQPLKPAATQENTTSH